MLEWVITLHPTRVKQKLGALAALVQSRWVCGWRHPGQAVSRLVFPSANVKGFSHPRGLWWLCNRSLQICHYSSCKPYLFWEGWHLCSHIFRSVGRPGVMVNIYSVAWHQLLGRYHGELELQNSIYSMSQNAIANRELQKLQGLVWYQQCSCLRIDLLILGWSYLVFVLKLWANVIVQGWSRDHWYQKNPLSMHIWHVHALCLWNYF